MARMMPAVDPSTIEHPSEQSTYVALRDGLPNDYLVLHSYPWLRPRRDETLREGEADFVIVHPDHGLLVLEVKGGETIRLQGTTWVRDTRSGARDFQDPFEQARKSMHTLVDLITERSGGKLSRRDFVFGYAVVFPHMDYRGTLPANADEKILFCQRHLAFIEQSVEVAYKRWGVKPSLSAHQRALLNECLLPEFNLFRPIGPTLEAANDKLLELTETQAQVFEGLYAQDRVLVQGVAGSGKTFLALHRALAFARAGRRTLFVCYNKDLARWLERRVDEDPLHAPYRAHLTIRNFHKLVAELAERAGLPFRPQSGGRKSQRFWDEEAPDLLEQAVQSLDEGDEPARFEALVVDEAQDFLEGWWYALSECAVRTLDELPVYAFMDPNQALRGEVEEPPVSFQARFDLTINCRNTKRIAHASASVLDLEARVYKSAPVGQVPRQLRAKSRQQTKGLVAAEVLKLLNQEGVQPRQLVLIGPAAQRSGSLSGLRDVGGVPLVSSAEAWRSGEGVLVTTARSFKGLEADVVVLYDLAEFGDIFSEMDLYVACTRAKHLLIACAVEGAVRAQVERAVAGAEGG